MYGGAVRCSQGTAAASSVQGDTDPDAQVLEALKKAGSNLSKPHPIEFFLYFANEDQARKAADQIRGRSFEVTVDHAGKGDSWLCLATKSMIPELGELHRIRADFNAIARAQSGQYDGWGTPVVE